MLKGNVINTCAHTARALNHWTRGYFLYFFQMFFATYYEHSIVLPLTCLTINVRFIKIPYSIHSVCLYVWQLRINWQFCRYSIHQRIFKTKCSFNDLQGDDFWHSCNYSSFLIIWLSICKFLKLWLGTISLGGRMKTYLSYLLIMT